MSGVRAYANRLDEGLAGLGLDLSGETREKLLAYGDLLLKWNRIYNLTALRSPREVVTHHLLDALAVLPLLARFSRIADIGSGAGLPGIPLCIARAELTVHSVEAVNKKASFQRQAKIELELANFHVENLRVEQFRPEKLFPAVVSRAFASLSDFVASSAHLLEDGGRLLAMKGQFPEEEIAALPDGWRVGESATLTVPGLEAQRHLIEIVRV